MWLPCAARTPRSSCPRKREIVSSDLPVQYLKDKHEMPPRPPADTRRLKFKEHPPAQVHGRRKLATLYASNLHRTPHSPRRDRTRSSASGADGLMPITGTVSPADSSAARRDAINTPRPGSSRSWSEVVFTPQQGGAVHTYDAQHGKSVLLVLPNLPNHLIRQLPRRADASGWPMARRMRVFSASTGRSPPLGSPRSSRRQHSSGHGI